MFAHPKISCEALVRRTRDFGTAKLKYPYSDNDSMLRLKKISETYDMKVFTDLGDYFGDVEEAIITNNKVYGWRVRATKNSFLTKVLGSAKGVIVPHQLVKAIGDIVIISRTAVPSYSEEEGQQENAAGQV